MRQRVGAEHLAVGDHGHVDEVDVGRSPDDLEGGGTHRDRHGQLGDVLAHERDREAQLPAGQVPDPAAVVVTLLGEHPDGVGGERCPQVRGDGEAVAQRRRVVLEDALAGAQLDT